MSRRGARAQMLAGRAMLWLAAWLVPAEERQDWLGEWRGELWQVCRETDAEGLGFSLGAWPDAWELRRMGREGRGLRPRLDHSAGYCLLVLAAMLAGGWWVALRSPEVVAERHAERYALASDLVFIKDARVADWQPSVEASSYRRWAASRQQYFSGFAFYRLATEAMEGAGAQPVATSSAGLFTELGLRMEQGWATGTGSGTGPGMGLVLSDSLWRRAYAADPAILGRSVRVGQRQVRVVAILPDGAWRLPGRPQAWLLLPDNQLQDGAPGYAVARMRPEVWPLMWQDRISIEAFDRDGNAESLWAVSLHERARGPWGIYLFALLLALLGLPALNSVLWSEQIPAPEHGAHSLAAPRWIFLGLKFALLAGILYVVPLDLVYAGNPGYQPAASALHLLLTLILSVAGAGWALADQRKRCPVCLRRVTHPARVGMASHTFLNWNGTELICTGGHTLLEVPSLPTSWFGAPRWVYLDASWQFLFGA